MANQKKFEQAVVAKAVSVLHRLHSAMPARETLQTAQGEILMAVSFPPRVLETESWLSSSAKPTPNVINPCTLKQMAGAATLPCESHLSQNMEESAEHISWKEWLHQHGGRLLLCARQWTRSVADAEDVVQEAFVRFWRHQRKLGGDPMGLLLTSIRRAAFDLARHNQRRTARESAADGLFLDGESLFEPLPQDDARRQAIEAALRDLSSEQRQVLVLKIWGERTFDQIGTELGISPHTAASRYRYALSALRKKLTPANHYA